MIDYYIAYFGIANLSIINKGDAVASEVKMIDEKQAHADVLRRRGLRRCQILATIRAEKKQYRTALKVVDETLVVQAIKDIGATRAPGIKAAIKMLDQDPARQ